MKTKLKWRLSKLPTVQELQDLVKDKTITKDEARDILFTEGDSRDEESMKQEIDFLKKLVEKLSDNSNRTVEIIREVQVPYQGRYWYRPYDTWCSSTTNLMVSDGTTTIGDNTMLCSTSGSGGNTNAIITAFSDIETM